MGMQINPTATVSAIFGQVLTMSSREIADLVEKRHDKVKQSIDRLAERAVIVRPQIEDEQETATTPTGGRRTYSTSVYYMEKRDSFVVVAQLSPEFTARLVDRWQQLEEEKERGPQSIADWARIAIAQEERNQALQIENHQKDEEIGELTPKAEAYEAYLSEEGVCRITDSCNKHGVKRNHPGYVLRGKGMLHQKKVLATQIGLKSSILKNVLEKDGFEYIDTKGQSVEAQQAMISRQREVSLLKMIVDAYGQTAFRNPVAFVRAKNLIGGAA